MDAMRTLRAATLRSGEFVDQVGDILGHPEVVLAVVPALHIRRISLAPALGGPSMPAASVFFRLSAPYNW
jgi:hypothetical protein